MHQGCGTLDGGGEGVVDQFGDHGGDIEGRTGGDVVLPAPRDQLATRDGGADRLEQTRADVEERGSCGSRLWRAAVTTDGARRIECRQDRARTEHVLDSWPQRPIAPTLASGDDGDAPRAQTRTHMLGCGGRVAQAPG